MCKLNVLINYLKNILQDLLSENITRAHIAI